MMQRDYKRSPPQRQTPAPCWIWGLGGLGVGLLIALIAYVAKPTHLQLAAEAPQAAETSEIKALPPEESEGDAAPLPRFDFYRDLPARAVNPPIDQSEPLKPSNTLELNGDAPPSSARVPAQRGDAPETSIEESAAARSQSPTLQRPNLAASRSSSSGPKLQVGSFRKRSEAEEMRAQIALLGYQAHIEQARIEGRGWYRVRLGPFAERAELTAAEDELQERGISTLRIPGGS